MSKNKKILITEDEKSMLQALEDTFKSENFDILKAENGEKGLEVAFKEHPDVILIDIVMPKMDGITMLKKLREDDWGKNVPVMILTNLGDMEKMAEAVKDGNCNYLIKTDWSLKDIFKKVKKII